MVSAILGFFVILLKFMAIIMVLFLAGYLLVLPLRTIKLHAIGIVGLIAGLLLYAFSTEWSDVRTPILAGILLIAWLACIKKAASVPKEYRRMKSVSSTIDMAWASLYAFGAGSFALVVPVVENKLPWTIKGYDWYLYISLAMLALMPVVMISGNMDDIEKLKQIVKGRTEITEDDLFDMVEAISKEDASENDLKEKHKFVQEYLAICNISVREVQPAASQAVEEPPSNVQAPSPVTQREKTTVKTVVTEPPAPTKPVDINTASESALAAIPGIGIILAKKAISIRDQKGKFESVDDFISSEGIRPYQEAHVRQMITCPEMNTNAEEASARKTRGRAVEF